MTAYGSLGATLQVDCQQLLLASAISENGAKGWAPAAVDPSSPAYILFTSGMRATGEAVQALRVLMLGT